MSFLTLECLTHLQAPIPGLLCPGATNEQEKRCVYDERVREVERACFSLLVFSASGGMGPSATTVYKKLASMLADKWDMNYSKCLFWLRCRLCFSLLRSAIMCLRGHQSSIHRPIPACIDPGA